MYCPECMESRSWVSTRCPKCTTFHSLLFLWLFNLVIGVGALLLLFVLIWILLAVA